MAQVASSPSADMHPSRDAVQMKSPVFYVGDEPTLDISNENLDVTIIPAVPYSLLRADHPPDFPLKRSKR